MHLKHIKIKIIFEFLLKKITKLINHLNFKLKTT